MNSPQSGQTYGSSPASVFQFRDFAGSLTALFNAFASFAGAPNQGRANPQAYAPTNQAPYQTSPSAPPQPGPAPTPAQNEQNPLPDGWGSYKLQFGDTIWDLANRKGGISLEDFSKYNPDVDLENYKAGQAINLPPSALGKLENWAPATPSSGSNNNSSSPTSSSSSSSPSTPPAPTSFPVPTSAEETAAWLGVTGVQWSPPARTGTRPPNVR